MRELLFPNFRALLFLRTNVVSRKCLNFALHTVNGSDDNGAGANFNFFLEIFSNSFTDRQPFDFNAQKTTLKQTISTENLPIFVTNFW